MYSKFAFSKLNSIRIMKNQLISRDFYKKIVIGANLMCWYEATCSSNPLVNKITFHQNIKFILENLVLNFKISRTPWNVFHIFTRPRTHKSGYATDQNLSLIIFNSGALWGPKEPHLGLFAGERLASPELWVFKMFYLGYLVSSSLLFLIILYYNYKTSINF